MNLEFHSAGKPTMNGLMGISTKTDNSKISQSEGNEKSAQFKDLLNQSKQDIKQADRQLETARENRRDLKDLEDSPKTEDRKLSTEAQSKDNTEKVESDQATETEPKELQVDENQVDSSLLTVENAQLMGIQSLQGGIENVLANLNGKLGLAENVALENLVEQVSGSQLVDMKDQNTGVLATEEVPLFNGALIDETQSTGANGEMVVIDEMPAAEMVTGLDLKAKPETVSTDDLTTAINIEGKPNQTKTIGEPMNQNVDSQNQQAASDDSSTEDGNSQKLMDSTAEDVNAQKPMDSTVEDVNAQKPMDSTDEDVNDQKLMDSTTGINATAAFDVELTKVSGTENTVLQPENQSLGEKGAQEINTSSINTTKGSEVQTNNNTPVVQQVAQKILQNFEPNKPMVLQMTLSPENLGDIEVQLKYDQGKLVIDIMAASRETQNLLGKQINQLVRGLALQNVQVETVHINTPVEASSTGENTSSLMNSGSDFSQQQNNAQLRESFLRNSSIQNSLLITGSENGDEGVVSIAQNLQYNGQRRINYYV